MIILSNSNIVYRIINREVCLLSTKNKKRIMIIDDDKDITNLFALFLEYNGYSVDAYTNPLEAFNNIRKNSHDLILLDLKMPKMDGMTLYYKIKEIDSNVIICFTTADINNIQQLQKGIIDIDKIVLYKPVLLKDLKNKIDWMLSRQELLNSNKPTTTTTTMMMV
jgi:DNA-binding response OmpR family regulator